MAAPDHHGHDPGTDGYLGPGPVTGRGARGWREDLERQSAYALDRCIAGPGELPPGLRADALTVVESLLLAGLPVFNVEAAADGDDNGVELVVEDEPGGPVPLAVWRQHPAVSMLGEPFASVQAAMHQAVRGVLSAYGHRLRAEQDEGRAPTILPAGPRGEDMVRGGVAGGG
ncbi:hypothetical protein ACIOGZ_28740 [Kitasatospora sp. NPDC088160]|uniref:hypothetical protein n=1 Tax=Kitasatospora sp. NPDC088160 TaxID=3364072 RepID=UPI00381F2D92